MSSLGCGNDKVGVFNHTHSNTYTHFNLPLILKPGDEAVHTFRVYVFNTVIQEYFIVKNFVLCSDKIRNNLPV
jgi:hypothetical protein